MSSVRLPSSLGALWPLLEDPQARVMAGGTDLLVRLRAGLPAGPICCLERIPALRGVSVSGRIVRIGAATTLTEVLESGDITAGLPLLGAAVRQLGSPLVRNQATLGGNVCTASPAGDTLPALYALGATLELASRSSTRAVPVEDFITGPGRTVLRAGEILAAVRVPLPDSGTVQHFEKIGRRRAMAISVASLAACLELDGGRIRRISLALGSVAPTVLRCREAEAWLAGRELTADNLTQAADLVRTAVRPVGDMRATADYRRQAAANLLLRLVALQP
jgi:xanthine dehydrogenase FAD-binding subunit